MSSAGHSSVTVLAFDFGERKVGVAVGNSVSGTAEPLATINYTANALLFARISELLEQWGPDRLVVGRPLAEDGVPTSVTRLAERFARRLAGRFSTPVTLVDERFSSLQAQADIRDQQSSGRASRADSAVLDEDAQAAAIILRQYLHDNEDS